MEKIMSGSSSLKKKYAVNHENKYCSEIFRFMFSGIDFEIDQKKPLGGPYGPLGLGVRSVFGKNAKKSIFLTHFSHLVFYFEF